MARSFIIELVLAAFALPALACPLKSGFTDYNCDGQIRIAVVGDSLVYGIGDTKNGGQGGYVLRTGSKLSGVEFINLGEPGLTTVRLLQDLKQAFKGSSEKALRDGLLDTDVVILDLGRNDRWSFAEPKKIYRNLKRIAQTISAKVEVESEVAPLVVTTVLMLPNRGSQGPWVAALDKLIAAGNSQTAPSDLRFDKVSKRLLSDDQIHPTPAGYEALAKTLVKYINTKLAPLLTELRPDADADGIADFFETLRYGTDPTLYDTDGDGLSDGQEIFDSQL